MIPKKLFIPIGMFILFIGILLYGETSLSGDLSKYQLDSTNSPFIIDKDIEVPSAKKVVINAGCVFLFKQFTGLNVSGSLIVNGTQSRPVIFTTINDSAYSGKAGQTPNPFDWNGITLDKSSADVVFNEFKLMYSVYGIKSQRRNIVIKNGIFKSNGQFHFTIFDKIQYVQDNMSFTYPDDSTMVDLGPQKSYKTTLSISSFPAEAEIYLNTKPGKRIRPDAHTPAIIKNIEGSAIQMTLFKKGYSDTTILLNLGSNVPKNVDISLAPIRAAGIDDQNQLLHDRFNARLGKCFFITTPLLIGAGAGFLYYAEKAYDKAKKTRTFLENTLLPSTDPKVVETQQQYNDEVKKADMKRNFSIASFGVGVMTLSIGLLLYF
jgi:hypothetical protein